MKLFTLEKNLFHASFVVNAFHGYVVKQSMKEFTLGKSHLSVGTVQRHLITAAAGYFMKESTQGISVIAAHIAKRNSHTQVI